MTPHNDTSVLVDNAQRDLHLAHERATWTFLRAIRSLVVAAYPDATAIDVSESDQGPWLWFDAVIDPTVPSGEITWDELEGELPDALSLITSLIDDGEWRGIWESIAVVTKTGWEIHLGRIP